MIAHVRDQRTQRFRCALACHPGVPVLLMTLGRGWVASAPLRSTATRRRLVAAAVRPAGSALRATPLTEDQIKEVVRHITADRPAAEDGAIDGDEIAAFIEDVTHHDASRRMSTG